MKRLLAFVVTTFILTSCVKENTPTVRLDNTVDTAGSVLQYKGNFMNGPYGRVMGMAGIYQQDGKLVLAFKDVTISNGPDLHVYLSREVLPVNFIDLGRLQSTNGNQVYDIPGTPDLMQYKYALVHCKQYNHLFGSAELQ